MPQPTGFTMPLSIPRQLMCDYLHFARKVPSVPVQRRININRLIDAREQAAPRPGWCSIFTKAWAIICNRTPALRRAYLGGPFPRLYQHPISVASIAVERPYGDEEAVFFKQLSEPNERSLTDIDSRLRRFKDQPLPSSAIIRRSMRISRMPWPMRHAAWWMGLNFSGRLRARMLGTFGVTVYASLGASSLHPPSLLTTTLNYGVIEDNGDIDVRIIYDHRVLDGGTIARALGNLERVLNDEIVNELGYFQTLKVA